MRKSLAIMLVAAGSIAAASPALSQGIQIGPDGIRLVPQQQQAPVARSGGQRGGQGIGERDAVRVARSEGVQEIETVSRSDRAFRVVGYDRRGDDIQVDVDRRNGAVLSVR